jgi:hypothetical protein
MNAIAESVSAATAPPRRRTKPLLPLRAVAALTDKSKNQVLELIEEGSLPWCWDVALNRKDGHKRELRILPACVADYLRGRVCGLEWAEVRRLLLPDGEPMLVATDISRLLNVSGTHTSHLIKRKLLTACSAWRRGPGGSARVTADSFIGFLKARRVL